MAFKALHHQDTKLLNRCLQSGGDEHFAWFTFPMVARVGLSILRQDWPRTESCHSHLQQSVISLAFSNLHTYLKTN